MKISFFILSLTLATICFPSLSLANKDRCKILWNSDIQKICTSAVPQLKYDRGDRSWNDGYYTNAFVRKTEVETASCYTIYQSDKKLSASQISEKIKLKLIQTLDLPINDRSHHYEVETPEGLNSNTYSRQNIISQNIPTTDGDLVQAPTDSVLVTIEVVAMSNLEYSVSINYTVVVNPW